IRSCASEKITGPCSTSAGRPWRGDLSRAGPARSIERVAGAKARVLAGSFRDAALDRVPDQAGDIGAVEPLDRDDAGGG
ncbi:hypothetical protein C1T15_28880, partial [Escherichia coli]